jgi:hypothetical protein
VKLPMEIRNHDDNKILIYTSMFTKGGIQRVYPPL